MKKVSEFIDSLGDELKEEVLTEMKRQGVEGMLILDISVFAEEDEQLQLCGMFDFYKAAKEPSYWWKLNEQFKA